MSEKLKDKFDPSRIVRSVVIKTPHGNVKGKYFKSENESMPVAMILPPHPYSQITMDNVLIYNIFHVFKDSGFSVLRIDFPEHPIFQDVKRIKSVDLMFNITDAMLNWLSARHIEASHYWLCGFSMSCSVVFSMISRRPDIENFVAISPVSDVVQNKIDDKKSSKKSKSSSIKTNAIKVSNFSGSTFPTGIYFYGSDDQILPAETHAEIAQECQKKNPGIEYHEIPDADHYFTSAFECIQDLKEKLTTYVKISLATRITIPIRKRRRRRKKREESIF